ncbi:MAG: radical SAM protein [Planctomycetes bacterium]|jgi:uncharacterized protein|nr:radical SAM protein [Planctomycetota bacterium]
MVKDIKKNIVLYLHLTMDCNLACKYCYSGEKRNEIMTKQIAFQGIDYFLPFAEKLTVRFIGGEPLLEPDLLKATVQYANEQAKKQSKKIDYVIITNGTLFTENIAQFCTRNKIEVSLSFDGSKESQDTNRVYRDGRSSFMDIESNIPRLLKHNPYSHVVRVVTPTNVQFLFSSVQYLFEKGLRNITLSPDYTNKNLADFLPQIKEQYQKIADLYIEYKKQHKWAFINILEPTQALYQDAQQCKLGTENFSLSPDGTIYPCCNFVDQKIYPLGNVQTGIDSTLNNIFLEKLAQLDKELEQNHQNCPSSSRCRRRCGCTNLVTTGKMEEVAHILCEYGKLEDEIKEYVNTILSNSTTKV